ncbi:uncharacterized protein LOC129338003 isoform X2 [Eublepharis macularius]|uniref:Uncharacterized protein LOC129338003 isoform X2 n=1 Tax=Eublepharis macularius TaxID=481883 RepID=A0AA97K3R5_EUBMA|nr:uncharacterized protein LOC129338003 isoform X2 [Eublepharis macularius]
MGSWLLWGLVAAFALAAFTALGQGAELRDAAWEAEGEPSKDDLTTLRLYSTTHPLRRQRNRTKNYRTGSLSVLSRIAIEDLGLLEEEKERNISRPERDAVAADPCLGCCGTPNRPGSREPSKGDPGPLGNIPTAATPRGNGTQGNFRPGAYTPMRMARKTGSLSQILWNHSREASPNRDRCQGCCGANATTSAKPPERREEGKGSRNNPSLGRKRRESSRAWRRRCTWKGIPRSCVASVLFNKTCADEFPTGLGPCKM